MATPSARPQKPPFSQLFMPTNHPKRKPRLNLKSLNNGETPLDLLVERLRGYLFLPDRRVIHAVLGAMAGNMMEGSPCWLMVVGPPSDGKTELINGLLHVAGVHPLHKVTGAASFLSATSSKERAKDATGGVFRLIGWHGAILFDDFTSVLSLDKRELDEVLDVFRQSYGGTWSRDVGTDGGKRLKWGPGKVGFLGGVTGVIDGQAEVSASLGERFLYYRTANGYKVSEEVKNGTGVEAYEKARRALLNEEGHAPGGAEGWQEDMRGLLAAYFMGLGLGFGVQDRWYEKGRVERELSNVELGRLIHIAEVASRARSAVVRDKWNKEMVGVHESERAPRMARALRQLYVGMEAVGVQEEQSEGGVGGGGVECGRWEVIRKVALDSMPATRRMVLEGAWAERRAREEGKGKSVGIIGVDQLAAKMRTDKKVVKRAAEDLEVHGCVEIENVGGHQFVGLTEKMWRDLKKGWER